MPGSAGQAPARAGHTPVDQSEVGTERIEMASRQLPSSPQRRLSPLQREEPHNRRTGAVPTAGNADDASGDQGRGGTGPIVRGAGGRQTGRPRRAVDKGNRHLGRRPHRHCWCVGRPAVRIVRHRENRRENHTSAKTPLRRSPAVILGQLRAGKCAGQTAYSALSATTRPPVETSGSALRIRRLGVRIPPRALAKWEGSHQLSPCDRPLAALIVAPPCWR